MRSGERSSIVGSLCLVSLLVGSAAIAKPAHPKAAAAAAPAAAAEPPPAADEPAEPETESQKQFKSIQWTRGPAKVSIGDHADLQVPEGFAYTGSSGAQKLLELMHNPTSGNELGILTDSQLELFVEFTFQDIGYVKDAAKEKLDADEILKSIKEGNEEANETRQERGWAPIHVTGWHTPPFYNHETNNLEWCIQAESQGHTIVNYNTRILGRRGVMSANLMVDPDKLNETLPRVKKVLAGFAFVDGQRYSQFLPGDKIAKYGLSALVVGGAVGLAAKTGLLAKLGILLAKLWKAVALGAVAIFAGIKKMLFGRKQPRPGPPAGPPPATTV